MYQRFDNFPLLGWLSRYVKISNSDGPDNIYGDCPFCKGHQTFAASKVHNIFVCFRCKEGRHSQNIWKGACGLIRMVMLLERCNYNQAIIKINYLCNRYIPVKHVPSQRATEPQEIYPRDSLWLRECKLDNPGKQILRKRGVEHLIDTSKYCLNGRYADRIILPAFYLGKAQGFEAKACYKSQEPKTLYPNWFRTGENIYTTYGWDWSKNFAVVTESILDAETLGMNAIGLYGSSLKITQIYKLLELRHRGINNLIWMLDGDALRKELKIIFEKTNNFFTNHVALLPKKEDPNSVGRDEAWSLISKATHVANELDALPLLLKNY